MNVELDALTYLAAKCKNVEEVKKAISFMKAGSKRQRDSWMGFTRPKDEGKKDKK